MTGRTTISREQAVPAEQVPAAGLRGERETWGFRTLEEQRAPAAWIGIAIFILVTATAVFSQQIGRPITAAIVYLLGVTIVGGLHGMRGGLAAALAASLIYNFFISDPVFRFSLTSAEELVPLLAFNLSAAASAALAGRLRERAVAAETANRRVNALLDVSRGLQAAAQVEQIPAVIHGFVTARGSRSSELYHYTNGELVPIDADRATGLALAETLLARGTVDLEMAGNRAMLLSTGAGAVGVLILIGFAPDMRSGQQQDLAAFLNLLGIALERCLLLERLSEAELVRRSEMFKTTLLSSVSHDMRTPLGAISASASSLRRYGDALAGDVRADLIATIEEQCGRLNRYTANLLGLVRLQSGVDAAAFTECEALEVLGAAISRARATAGGREIAKHYALAGAIVRADPVMLEQVFYNVLENAIRYSPADTPIEVSTSASDGQLRVAVSDRGPGIAAGDSARIFERFYRSSTVAHQEGSGLGLSIAKGFTEAFGGTIRLAEPGDAPGTTVEIILPAERME
ncbi:DUF4118 domain-containing protein [Sphingomonas parva]|uniref:histidine kinase n=1 Tax=Sphingomonas parva TaxID=2555898 RepID=A0A4Y8ZTX1_9SPHN|nr:ATP-binding protein [Sphingomonas parva]TFI58585.1 DUF4118 domain-containing protein [Sphingomonas parva]